MRTACINTTYYKDPQGYGSIQVNGKTERHHRVAYCQANNVTLESIKGLVIMHKCDNPSCINPEHLAVGTHADNTADMYAKGRNAINPPPVHRGTANGNSKLTEDKVKEIKIMLTKNKYSTVAEAFGISKATVAQIATGKTWKHVTI